MICKKCKQECNAINENNKAVSNCCESDIDYTDYSKDKMQGCWHNYPTSGSFELNNVKHPSHYTGVVPDIECIQVTQHFNFCRGNAIKYIWRAGEKDKSKEIEDLQKAIQYLEFEIKRLSL